MHILCARPPVHQSRRSTCLLNAEIDFSSHRLIKLPVIVARHTEAVGLWRLSCRPRGQSGWGSPHSFLFARARTVLAEVPRDRRKVALKEDCDVTLVDTKSYHHRRSYPAHAASSVISTRGELATRNLVRLPWALDSTFALAQKAAGHQL